MAMIWYYQLIELVLNKPKRFFLNLLISKDVMAIFVPPKSPNIWQPILGPASGSFSMLILSMPVRLE